MAGGRGHRKVRGGDTGWLVGGDTGCLVVGDTGWLVGGDTGWLVGGDTGRLVGRDTGHRRRHVFLFPYCRVPVFPLVSRQSHPRLCPFN